MLCVSLYTLDRGIHTRKSIGNKKYKQQLRITGRYCCRRKHTVTDATCIQPAKKPAMNCYVNNVYWILLNACLRALIQALSTVHVKVILAILSTYSTASPWGYPLCRQTSSKPNCRYYPSGPATTMLGTDTTRTAAAVCAAPILFPS